MSGPRFAFSLKAFSVKHEIKLAKMPSYICIKFLIKILAEDNSKTTFAFRKPEDDSLVKVQKQQNNVTLDASTSDSLVTRL